MKGLPSDKRRGDALFGARPFCDHLGGWWISRRSAADTHGAMMNAQDCQEMRRAVMVNRHPVAGGGKRDKVMIAPILRAITSRSPFHGQAGANHDVPFRDTASREFKELFHARADIATLWSRGRLLSLYVPDSSCCHMTAGRTGRLVQPRRSME